MSIRQQADFDGKNWHGYIEFGGNVSEVKEELPLAKEVLVGIYAGCSQRLL